MKITKYEHACLVVDDGEDKIIIDPGMFSTSLPEVTDVKAVVITHIHGDHFDPERIASIVKNNPDAEIYTVEPVAKQLPNLNTTIVGIGNIYETGSFKLEFFGGKHAIIHESIPQEQNIGILVNNALYYPGDSFVTPGKPINVLALPASAPWMKTGEAIDFISSIKPQVVFPIHDAMLSEIGHGINGRLLTSATQQSGGTYKRLKTGESLSL